MRLKDKFPTVELILMAKRNEKPYVLDPKFDPDYIKQNGEVLSLLEQIQQLVKEEAPSAQANSDKILALLRDLECEIACLETVASDYTFHMGFRSGVQLMHEVAALGKITQS